MFATDLNIFNLNDIVGQDTIVKTLKNAFKSGNFPSVLYLIGQSGSGKSLIADIVSATLNCSDPQFVNGIKSPCGKCSSCIDIKEGYFQLGVRKYNGGMLNVDGLKEIENFIQYSSIMFPNKIIIINEAQIYKDLRRLLEIIEQKTKDTYFIFTSTDTEKFKNTVSSKENADQEKQALRSRGCFLNFKPINEKVISDFLFRLLQKIDPDGLLPIEFIEQGLTTIASNANGNLRLAINDFKTALDGEVYTSDEIISLLGYVDEKDYVGLLMDLCYKRDTAVNRVLIHKDIYGFFVYAWRVLTDTQMYDLSPGALVNRKDYQVQTSIDIIKSGNLYEMLDLFSHINSQFTGNTNSSILKNIFIYNVCKYLSIRSPSTVVLKKIKKVVN